MQIGRVFLAWQLMEHGQQLLIQCFGYFAGTPGVVQQCAEYVFMLCDTPHGMQKRIQLVRQQGAWLRRFRQVTRCSFRGGVRSSCGALLP